MVWEAELGEQLINPQTNQSGFQPESKIRTQEGDLVGSSPWQLLREFNDPIWEIEIITNNIGMH